MREVAQRFRLRSEMVLGATATMKMRGSAGRNEDSGLIMFLLLACVLKRFSPALFVTDYCTVFPVLLLRQNVQTALQTSRKALEKNKALENTGRNIACYKGMPHNQSG